jgi:hypothetical protein
MATGADVLSMLIPEGGWIIYGDDFDSIIYVEGAKTITQKQFTDGFAKYDDWKTKQAQIKTNARQSILDRLGITADEAVLLLQ